jgi:hypothetical protein
MRERGEIRTGVERRRSVIKARQGPWRSPGIGTDQSGLVYISGLHPYQTLYRIAD